MLRIPTAKTGEDEGESGERESAGDVSIRYFEHEGEIGEVEEVVAQTLETGKPAPGLHRIGDSAPAYKTDEPTQVVTGKKNDDGGLDIRIDTVVRDKPKANAARGVANIQKTKAKARENINSGKGGIPVKPGERKRRKTRRERSEDRMRTLFALDDFGKVGDAIRVNLLAKSGLRDNRVDRDLNILRDGVGEAAHHLREDGLLSALNSHFGLDRLRQSDKKSADGCTIAALLLMNAAMLHQRIAAGEWLPGVNDLATIKNHVDVVNQTLIQWSAILSVDFDAVLKPAVDVISSVQNTGKLAGLERALRHIAAEAERIAAIYADMGADHAGELFNKVMGNQPSDGAFFTRPAAASLAARLTLDACGDLDWSKSQTWRDHKALDPACGSGTLLAALLADMKRRASEAGADDERVALFQQFAVQETIKGLDINPVSLQLAASQLTAGNRNVRYQKMGLYQMPYGPDRNNPRKISAGTLELLGQKAIVSRPGELEMDDDDILSEAVWGSATDIALGNAVDAARNARIVIMNPPFTSRAKMGEKFPPEIKMKLRERADAMGRKLTQADPEIEDFVDKNSIAPLFVALADKCVGSENGVLTMINPTIALCNPSGLDERRILAQRWHIHTVLTGVNA